MTNGISVRLSNLSIGYASGEGHRVVAQGINESLDPGVLTCLIGANGVGKSTLLKTLSAFQPQLAGNILIGGRKITDFNAAELSKLIGVVLTDKPDVQAMTVGQMVAMGRAPYTGFWGKCNEEDMRIVGESLAIVGSKVKQDRRIASLSDGERQKVMIAKALAQQTPVIYLDEPTAFLDYPSKIEILVKLRQICRETNKTILLSTHDFELALQIADRIWLIDAGGKLRSGTPKQLAHDGVLSDFIDCDGIKFDAGTMRVRIAF